MSNTQKILLSVSLILIAASTRLFEHTDNFTPIMAIALFGGATLKKGWGILVPLAVMFVSDICLEIIKGTGFYPDQVFVYGSFLLVAFLSGRINKTLKPVKMLGTALGASAIFFIVTNFGAWLANPAYAKNIGGLIECYILGIPFAKPEILSTLLFTGVFTALYSYAPRLFGRKAIAA